MTKLLNGTKTASPASPASSASPASPAGTSSALGAAESDLAAIRARRTLAVVAPQGTLALVNTQWITGDPGTAQPVWGVPGLWSPLPAGLSGLRLSAAAADGVYVDGDLVDGAIMVAGMDSRMPSRIRFSDTLSGYIIANEDGEYALRVWDAASDAIRGFGSIEAFPYNPEWVVQARFTPLEGNAQVSIAHLKDEGKTRQKSLPGEIGFTKDGTDYRLAAFEDGPSLLLVFGDATNGDTSYSVGRFLRVFRGEDGTVTLDFNRAYLPPCAFSTSFNCPIPPAQNRFAVPIEAGERTVLGRDGRPLH